MKFFRLLATTLKLFLSIVGIVIVLQKIIDLFNDDQYKFDVDSLFNDQPEKPAKHKDRQQQFSYEDLFYG